MAKTTKKVKSRVTASKKSINQLIEDFTGLHCSDAVLHYH